MSDKCPSCEGMQNLIASMEKQINDLVFQVRQLQEFTAPPRPTERQRRAFEEAQDRQRRYEREVRLARRDAKNSRWNDPNFNDQ